MFGAGMISSYLKLVHIFSINPYLGPLQVSLGKMILDIFKWMVLYILVLFAFGCGLNQLLWYLQTIRSSDRRVVSTLGEFFLCFICCNVGLWRILLKFKLSRSRVQTFNESVKMSIKKRNLEYYCSNSLKGALNAHWRWYIPTLTKLNLTYSLFPLNNMCTLSTCIRSKMVLNYFSPTPFKE